MKKIFSAAAEALNKITIEEVEAVFLHCGYAGTQNSKLSSSFTSLLFASFGVLCGTPWASIHAVTREFHIKSRFLE